MQTKQLYIILFSKQEQDPIRFINNIFLDQNHHFWGAARDFAQEILSKNSSWRWLSYRVDDFASISQNIMQNKLQKWLFKAQLGLCSLKIDKIENTLTWLFDRFIAELKNLFDKRSKNYIDIEKIDRFLKIEIEDFYTYGGYIS